MDHFSENAWVDLARGFGASTESQGMKAHLASGCLKCKTAYGFWGRLQTMALAEDSYTPTANLVRLAKLEFAANQQIEPEKSTLASLLFDSFSQPLLAGVRSSAATARQLVYEAEGLVVDLRFDRLVPSGMVSAVGQILDKRVPRELLGGSPVVVWTDDGQLVATTDANGFGEFQLEFVPQERLRLTARVGRRKVHIPLTNLK
jgi:hypothetical protein